ncbi:MAG: T9SS type A sorting domain-containing protein [Saprospiraceae bacterium]
MKPVLVFCLSVFAQVLIAQSFTEVVGTPFSPASSAAVAFSDVDGDGDEDVLITGFNYTEQRISKLYLNDGAANFTNVPNTPFVGVLTGSIAFADVDGDGDEDVVIAGSTFSDGSKATILYINNGGGEFTMDSSATFISVIGAVAFADIDGDNDQDLIVSGTKANSVRATKLYLNDGSGAFSEVQAAMFTGVAGDAVAFADVDSDGDQDLMISGFVTTGSGSDKLTNLYLNNGAGSFSIVWGTPFTPVSGSAIAFGDFDNDGDEDVVVGGATGWSGSNTSLYLNDGFGEFMLKENTPFPGISNGEFALSDVDNDGDLDIMMVGSGAGARLYLNDSQANFSLVSGTPFSSVIESSAAFSDVDGDGDDDVLIAGYGPLTKLYSNNGEIILSNEKQGLPNDETYIKVYPNPSMGGPIFVEYESDQTKALNLAVYDINGKMLHSQKTTAAIGLNKLTIETGHSLTGVFVIKVDDGNSTSAIRLVVK